MLDQPERIPYKFISPLSESRYGTNGMLAGLDALRDLWSARMDELSSEAQAAIRQRSLRKLAIETGIIERLYEIEWGLTLTLIAEGFARDTIERHGGSLDDNTRNTLEAQRESLEMVLDFVRDGRQLSCAFIRELHAALTRTQPTYSATDGQGRSTELPLAHGEWKSTPNHVMRGDQRLLEYAPPEHVASEMENLVQFYLELDASSTHPIIIAAWLHHRFVQIHPFADGNGRVARALVLLVLQKHHFAPLVVDRFHRDKYLEALDSANEGDLAPLVRLFANLAGASLTAELENPAEVPSGSSAQVAKTFAEKMAELRKRSETKLVEALRPRSLLISNTIKHWFEGKSVELQVLFREQGLSDIHVLQDHQIGSDSEHRFWFREQIIRAAHRVGYFADFNTLAGWSGLRIKVGSQTLRFIAALHGAGRGSGVLAVITLAEIESRWVDDDDTEQKERVLVETTADAFRIVHSESTESINARGHELTDLLDEGLSIALASFYKRFS